MANKKTASTKSNNKPSAILNRRARFDYELGEEIVAGLILTGLEARSARDGHVHLKGSFVSIRNNELWLNNASFSLKLNQRGHDNAKTVDTSARKLLVKSKQIDQLTKAKQQGMSIVPTKLLTQGNYIKVVIALAKGKKHYDKRETIKKRDLERDSRRALSNR